MAVGNGVVIRFLADTSNAVTQIGKMEKALDRTLTSGEKFDVWSRRIGLSFAAAAGAAAAFATKLAIDGVQAALEDEKAARSLAQTLENLNQGFRTDGVEAFVDSLQRATGVSDGELRPALQTLLTATGDVDKAQKALTLALDVAAGSTKDLDSVVAALSKGFLGQTTALQRLGVGIDQAVLASKDMDAITGALSTKFSGQAAVAADTYQGRIDRLSVAADEAKEKIGYSLLNAVDALGKAFGGTGGATTAIDEFSNGVVAIVDSVAELITFLSRSSDATDTNTESTKNSTAAFRGVVQLIPVVGTWLSWLANRWEDNANAADEAQRPLDALTLRYEGLAAAARDAAVAQAEAQRKTAQTAASARYTTMAVQQYGADIRRDGGNLRDYFRELKDSVGGAGSSASSALKTTAEKVAELRDRLQQGFMDHFESEMGRLENALKTAQTELDQWKTGFRDSLVDAFDISGTFANAVGEDGKVVVSKWQAGVNQAFAQFEWYTNVLRAVKAQGGSDALIAYLREQGIAAGGAQGQAMLDNGLIPYFSEKLADVENIAATTANAMVPAFYTSGVAQAQQSYEGFRDNFKVGGPAYKAVMRVMDNLAEDAVRNARLNVEITRNVNEVITRVVQEIAAPKPVTGPKRALGGAVMAGTPYIVGEVGPELFVPSGSGSIVPNDALGGRALNVTVNAGVGDPRAIGQAVVEAITRFEQSNGKVYARAS